MFPSSSDAEFARGAELLKRGEVPDAQRAFLRTLELAPAHVGAHYLLGMIALRRGAFEEAELRMARALAINPNLAAAHTQRGAALAQLRRADDALESFGAAIALEPDNAQMFVQRANALQEFGCFEDSLPDYDRAIALAPAIAPFHNNRGFALFRLKRFEDALSSIDQALALNPNYALAHKNRGEVLSALKRPADALQSYDRALALKLNSAEALNNRGNVLKDLDRLDEALASYDAALAVSPDLVEPWYNRGIVLLELKRLQDAVASHDRAIALKPDYREALVARGLCKLAMGDFAGWREYENRWRVASHPQLHAPTDAPLWTGEDLRDRSILVCSERGLGDIVQFSRYVPLLAERRARVTFLVPDKLKRILGDLPIRTISAVTESDRFDFHCALMSLPHLLGSVAADHPLPVPYLVIDVERAAQWKQRLGAHGFKVGICWQGAAWQGGASILGRSVPLSEFTALSTIEGVRLISLQKGDGVEQLAAAGTRVETLGDDFDVGPDAFVDTIAVMEHLDLIVTCDTSIAHVAGARGRPTWIALQHVPEWRWGLEGDTTPWYPSARLFRQHTRGAWDGVFAEMASDVRTLMR